MYKYLFLLVSLFCSTVAIGAPKVKKVHCEYIYRAPENVSLAEAKRIALERAKIQAIEEAFGSTVLKANSTRVENREGHSQIDFLSVGGTEVKGEWIETIGEPVFDTPYYEQGMLVVKVKVTGRIREIVDAGIDFEVKLLRNGTDSKFESAEFKNGDDLYLYFKSPADGFLTVYLYDEIARQVYCLLPYKSSSESSYHIESDKPYVFFSSKDAGDEAHEVDEYTMTCNRSMERNVIYVIFSPHSFAKVNSHDRAELLPKELSFEDFQKWMVKSRSKDTSMEVRTCPITIMK